MYCPRRYSFLFFVLILLAHSICAEDVVRIGVTEKFKTLNPLVLENPEGFKILPIMYDELVQYNTKTAETRKILVRDIVWSADHLHLEMKLKDSVRCHDGKKLVPRDVIYTLQKYREAMRGDPLFNYFNNITNVEAIGDDKVRINFQEPNASSPFYLSYVLIAPFREGVSTPPEIGTGPFKLEKRKENVVFFQKNKHYFDKKPQIDEFQVIAYENFSQLWGALIKGETDFSYCLLPKDFNQLKDNPNFSTYKYLSSMCYMIAFSFEKDIFKNRELRKALNLAVDKEAIIKDCLDGMGVACDSPIYPDSWAYQDNVKGFGYDPAKALKMLNKCGWEDRDQDGVLEKDDKKLTFTILVDKGDTRKKIVVQRLTLYLAEIGVQVNAEFVDREELIKRYLVPRNFEAVFMQFRTQDPDFNYNFWHSSQIKNGFNCLSYKNEMVDLALGEGRKTFDLEKRKNAYARFQEAFMEDPPGILLFYPYEFLVANKKIKGIQPSSIDVLRTINHWSISP